MWTSLSSNLAAEVVTSAGYDWALIKPCAHRLVAKGVPVGTLVMHTAFAAELQNEGFSFVACGADAALLAKGSDALLARVSLI